jgi:hypothetical protein
VCTDSYPWCHRETFIAEVPRRWTHQRHPAANLEWSNPKIGRKLRDLNTTWQTGPNNIKEPISGSSSITLSVASVTWYGAQQDTTSPDEGVWRCFAILWSDHSMQERFTGVQAAAVLGDHSQAALERLGREPGEVRRHDESGQLEQRVVRVHRFA